MTALDFITCPVCEGDGVTGGGQPCAKCGGEGDIEAPQSNLLADLLGDPVTPQADEDGRYRFTFQLLYRSRHGLKVAPEGNREAAFWLPQDEEHNRWELEGRLVHCALSAWCARRKGLIT